jgi:tetratricopeptide (TPR) repeat protein
MSKLQDGDKFLKELDFDSAIAVFTDIIEQSDAKDRCVVEKPHLLSNVYALRGYALCFKEEKEGENLKKAIEDCSKALALLPVDSKERYGILRIRAYAYYLQALLGFLWIQI